MEMNFTSSNQEEDNLDKLKSFRELIECLTYVMLLQDLILVLQ